jgi:hypothetical protein
LKGVGWRVAATWCEEALEGGSGADQGTGAVGAVMICDRE